MMKKKGEDILHLLSFRMSNELFGIDVLKVQEVNMIPEITPIPKAPDFIEGMMDLRGEVIPIVDFRKRFGLKADSIDEKARVIIAEIDENVIGLMVESVSKVIRVEKDMIEATPPMLNTVIYSKYVEGVLRVDNRLLIIIDPIKIFSEKELGLLDEV